MENENNNDIWNDIAQLTEEQLALRNLLFSGNIDEKQLLELIDENGQPLFTTQTLLKWQYEYEL